MSTGIMVKSIPNLAAGCGIDLNVSFGSGNTTSLLSDEMGAHHMSVEVFAAIGEDSIDVWFSPD